MNLKSHHETLIIVAAALAVVFGSMAGGIAGYYASPNLRTPPPVDLGIEGLSSADQQAIIESLKDEQATISVVKNVMPSVVSIIIKKEFPLFFDDPRITEDDHSPTELFQVGGGTGFFVTENGLIVTNKHVVDDPDAVYSVVTYNGEEYAAEVIAKDFFLDLALIKVDGEGFKPARLGNSDRIQIGQTVLAIGNTLSEFQNSVTKGIISGIDRTIVADNGIGTREVIEEAIQTDAAISKGNSGGPLVNLYGEVIGVNTAISREGQSLGFAIPVNAIKEIIEDVIRTGRIIRPWLGVRYLMIDKNLQEELDLGNATGAIIIPDEIAIESSIIEGGPAAEAGLLPGDIIRFVDQIELNQDMSLGEAVHSFEPGDVVDLSIVRNGEEIMVRVTLQELDPGLFE